MAEDKFIPNLAGRVDTQVDQAIRYLYQAVYALVADKADHSGEKGVPSTKVGGDIIGTVDNALLIRKGPGAGTYTGFTKIALDENGRVVAIS
jgi:hypothetical protein